MGAGLLIKSFLLLQRPQTGFRPQGLLTLTLSLSGSPFAEPARRPVFFRELAERVRSIPGVEGAGFVNHVPVGGDTWGTSFTIEGLPNADPRATPQAVMRTITAELLGTMGIPLLRGRGFAAADHRRSGGRRTAGEPDRPRPPRGAFPIRAGSGGVVSRHDPRGPDRHRAAAPRRGGDR